MTHGAAKFAHEEVELRAELRGHTHEAQFARVAHAPAHAPALLLRRRTGVCTRLEQFAKQRVASGLHELFERKVQRVVVLVDELRRLVAHGSGEMAHEKALQQFTCTAFSYLVL